MCVSQFVCVPFIILCDLIVLHICSLVVRFVFLFCAHRRQLLPFLDLFAQLSFSFAPVTPTAVAIGIFVLHIFNFASGGAVAFASVADVMLQMFWWCVYMKACL